MEILGFEIPAAQWQDWLATAREFALPRAIRTGGVLVAAGLLYCGARWTAGRVERSITRRTQTEFDDILVELLRRGVLLSIGFWAAWRLGHIWELTGTSRLVAAVWIVALTFPIGSFVGEVLRVLEERVVPRTQTKLDDTALPLLNRIIRFLVIGAGVLVALEFLGIDVTPLLAGAGVMGLAISLAAKDTLSNVIAGILLILDRPFQVGDRIEIWSAPAETGTWGDVVEIGLRATKIRNPDNIIIVVPNNEIMRRDIINYTASGPDIRLRVPIGIAYDADVELAKRLVLAVVGQVEGVRPDPLPDVIVRSFGESAVNLELRVWVEDARRRRAVADEITGRVKTAFDAHGVEIPYPKRDLYLRSAPGAEPLFLPGTGGGAGVSKEREEESEPGTTPRGAG